MKLDALIEAILFAAAKPISVKQLADACGKEADEVSLALETLEKRLDGGGGGIMLTRNGREVELVTRAEAADVVSKIVNAEVSGELTRPALEALTILAYCGPMTRAELEQIRGVQSALILRNLMLRGLVEQTQEARLGQSAYAVTFDFVNHLGIPHVQSLPEYETLRGHTSVTDVLRELESISQPPDEPSESLAV